MPLDANLSPEQFEALLREAAKGVAPAELKPPTLLKRLMPYRKTLLKFKEEGYSSVQIAEFLKKPAIDIDASPSMLRTLLAQPRTTKKPRSKSAPAGTVKFTALPRSSGGPVSPDSAS